MVVFPALSSPRGLDGSVEGKRYRELKYESLSFQGELQRFWKIQNPFPQKSLFSYEIKVLICFSFV